MKWGVQARFSPIPVNTWSLWLVPVGGYIGPIGKVHFAPLGNRDGGCKAPIGKLHFVPQGCAGVGRMVAGRAGTVLASAIRWAATLAAGTGVQRGDGGTVAGGEGVSSEGERLYPRDAQGSAGWLRAGQGRCWPRRSAGRRRWRRERGCSAAMAGPWQEVKASAARVTGTVAPAGCPTLATPAA